MAKRDIKKLLNKKGWTGRELGILELTNTCVCFQQALEGKPQQPIVEAAELRKMLSTITDRAQGQVYNGYISIHEWLSVKYNIAQSTLQQALLNYKTLTTFILDASFAEDVYSYVEQLPAIMTQKQYDEIRAKRIDAYFKDEETGEELYSNVFNLVERAITYYLHLLQKDPKKPNPLKAIRKKYLAQPVKSSVILSRWNEVTDEGYYTIEDGSGRRSDTMTPEEWQAAITTPAMEKLLRDMKATDGSGTEYTNRVAEQRILNRAKVIFDGGTEEEADKLQQERDYREGLAMPVKWHVAEEPPKDVTKWDVIEQELLLDFYPADMDGSGDPYSESNFTRSMEDFVAEFPELVKAMLADIDKNFFKGEQGLSALPLSSWLTELYDWRQLYEKDFYSMREEAEADINIFVGNPRAYFNGLAILRPNNVVERSLCIDENGYYVEPKISTTLSNFTLEAFFTEAESYADNIEIVEDARATLVQSYYLVKGYNLALELIAKHFDVPELTVFQMDVEDLERKLDAYNALVPMLYKKIKDIRYQDKELQRKKLQVLRDVFPELDYSAITIPAENVEKAVALFKDFQAFKPEYTDEFYSLLFIFPQERDELDYYEDYEGDEDEDEGGLE